MPPHVEVWRSDRAGGDTKTPKSRRTLQLPAPAVDALKTRKAQQAAERLAAGALWQDTGLVFTTTIGTELDAANVRRAFRAVATQAGLQGSWAPRELRHSFVSLLSLHGVRIENIAGLVGHAGTTVTEKIYRQELRPVLAEGAEVMDRIFPHLGS